jgi:hypothetical protein
MDLTIYATLQGAPSGPVADSVWAEYEGRLLRAMRRWAVLPTELTLPDFDGVDSGAPRRAHQLRDVAPALSSVIGFTIDSAGALAEAHVAASSLSGAADTSMLVMLAQAAAHDFPPVPSSAAERGPARFDLVISSGEAAPGTPAVIVGRVAVPVWHLSRPARLVPKPRRGDATPARAGTPGADSATIEAVVDAKGRVEMTTTRIIRASALPSALPTTDVSDTAFETRADQVLSSLRFEPAQITGCSVAQLVVQPIVVPR